MGAGVDLARQHHDGQIGAADLLPVVTLPEKMAASCSMVSCDSGLAGWTTTAIPSRATVICFGSTPFSLAMAISSGFSSRESSAISQVLESRAAMPVPEPPPVTATETLGCIFMNASAQAWPRLTMVSEPLIWRELACWLSRLQPPSTRTSQAEYGPRKHPVFFCHLILLFSNCAELKVDFAGWNNSHFTNYGFFVKFPGVSLPNGIGEDRDGSRQRRQDPIPGKRPHSREE